MGVGAITITEGDFSYVYDVAGRVAVGVDGGWLALRYEAIMDLLTS